MRKNAGDMNDLGVDKSASIIYDHPVEVILMDHMVSPVELS